MIWAQVAAACCAAAVLSTDLASFIQADCWGTQWARSLESLLAEVPSAIVPEESNILVNPAYSGAARLSVRKLRQWRYDFRLSA
jgi:hypothetical protein